MLASRRVLCFLLCLGVAYAQDPRGKITGVVTDSSKAAVPNAEVRVTNVETGVAAVSKSNDAGNYTLPFLLPGTYRVSADADGFKKFLRDGVEVRVSETVALEIQMEVGALTETVEVKAETPMLDLAGASLGQVIDHRRITELPVAAGNPLQLMLLAPGIVEPSTFSWRAAWNFRQIGSDGNGVTNNEFQIDGVSNTFADSSAGQSRYAFAPPQSSVSGFKVETSPYDASVGHTIGALINVITKNGTNEFHGDAHWFVRNREFDSASFFNNKNGIRAPVYQDNRYGVALGGPVQLPKIYDGKNKTFWFYAYDANKWTLPQPFTGTLPTAAQRQGDFSALLNIPNTGQQYQIYDPRTTVSAPNGRFSRQPFPGNVIPTNRLDPVAVNLLKLYPAPNQTGTVDGRNNYFNSGKVYEDYYAHIARVDHAFSDQHRAYLRINYDWWAEDKNHYYNNDAQGLTLNRINRGLALDDVYVLSPSLILNVRYGLTQQEFPEQRSSRGIDLAGLGFSKQLTNLVDKDLATLPRVTISGYSGLSSWESGDGGNSSLTHSFAGNFTKVKGSHSVRFGADYRVYRSFGNRFPFSTSPDLNFGTEYTRGPLDNAASAPIGQQLASMLLGIPGGSMAHTASFAMQDKYLGLFIHDDFKVTRRLTLNLGLRYEYEWPLTERFNRLVSGFAFDTSNPIEAQAIANYAKSPIAELPVNQFRVRGGQLWVGSNGRSPFKSSRNDFLPRIGLAYQLTPKTIVRTGYGIFYDTMGVNATPANQNGFTQSTPIQASLDGGLTFIASTANPFPNGLLAPLGPAAGLTSNLGQAISFYAPDRTRPYAQRWSFGVQRMLPGQFVLDVEYVGNKGIRLPITQAMSPTDRKYLSTSPVRDQNTINFLTAQFANPFYGVNSIYGTQTNRLTMLSPYPQFASVTKNLAPLGSSWYHAMQMQVERRYAQSFTVQASYTWSKAMEAVQFLNPSDPAPYDSVGTFDRPQRLSMSGIWDVPLGKGKRFGATLPAPVQIFASGWQINGLVIRQAGPALGFGNAIFTGDVKSIALPKGQRSVSQWFNVNAGFNRTAAQQLQNNIRTLPLLFSGVRGDGRATWDFSAIKNFTIDEDVILQFRAECYNSLNHANFNGPNTDPTSSAFGTITGTASDPRNWQFSLKLKF